jgi:transmembrane sensor
MQDLDYEILIKYFDGECSEEEKKQLDFWLQDEKNRAEFELVKKIWSAQAPELPEPDVEAALNNVWKGIKNYHSRRSTDIYRPDFAPSKSESKNFFSRDMVRAAAIILAFVIGVYFIGKYFNTPETISILVAKTKTQSVTLYDGSKVKLDAGSRFSYPEKFIEDTRTVSLSGEGYFEITPDPKHPFVILTREAKITVLGTKFNVRSWDESEKVTVAVADGKVNLSSLENEGDSVVISKGFVSSITEGENPLKPVQTDVNEYLSWQNKEKSFQSVTFREIADQLERWYDLKFVMPNDSYYDEILTINITNTSVEEILNLVSTVMNMSYTRSGNTITFEKL